MLKGCYFRFVSSINRAFSMIETVHAVVLRAENLSDYDQRLVLYTKEFGKIRANIIGVKKIVSRLRYLTIPFAEFRLQVYLHGGKRKSPNDPGKVIGGEALQYRSILSQDWERMVHSSAMLEMLDALTQSFYPNAREYDWLAQSLDQMQTTSSPLLTRCRFALGLLKILGYSLRSHAMWNYFSEQERGLLDRLAKWNSSDSFSYIEERHLESLTKNYLERYLPYPLKTEIFRQKCNAFA